MVVGMNSPPRPLTQPNLVRARRCPCVWTFHTNQVRISTWNQWQCLPVDVGMNFMVVRKYGREKERGRGREREGEDFFYPSSSLIIIINPIPTHNNPQTHLPTTPQPPTHNPTTTNPHTHKHTHIPTNIPTNPHTHKPTTPQRFPPKAFVFLHVQSVH